MKDTKIEFYKKADDQIVQSLLEEFKDNLEHKFIHSSGEIFFKFKLKTEPGLLFKITSLFKKDLAVCSSSFLQNKVFLAVSYRTLQYCYHVFIQKFADGYTTVDIISHKDQIEIDDFEKLKRIEAFSGDF